MYEVGDAVAQKLATAREFDERADDGGDVFAVTSLGKLHEGGLGVPRDYAKAFDFYRRATEYRCLRASFLLGNIMKGV